MLWTIIVILLVLWLLGMVANLGSIVWLLLVIAAIVLVYQVISGRRTV